MSFRLLIHYERVPRTDNLGHRYYVSYNQWIESSLTTGNSVSGDINVTGSPLTEGGSITLVGTTRFPSGHLEGHSGSLVITGNISPHP